VLQGITGDTRCQNRPFGFGPHYRLPVFWVSGCQVPLYHHMHTRHHTRHATRGHYITLLIGQYHITWPICPPVQFLWNPCIACVNGRVAKLFCVKASACDWSLQDKSPVSYWWPTASCCSSRESCELLKQQFWQNQCMYMLRTDCKPDQYIIRLAYFW